MMIWSCGLDLLTILTLLIVGKCCFSSTFVVDKKAIFLIVAIFAFEVLGELLQKSAPWFSDAASLMIGAFIIWIVVRGGKGRAKRALSMLEMCASLMVGPMCLCSFMVMLVKPDLSEEAMLNSSMPIYMALMAIILVYVYFTLYRKEIYLHFQRGERVLLLLFDSYIFALFSFALIETEDTGTLYLESGLKYIYVVTMAGFYLVFLGVMLKNRMTDYYRKGQEYQQEWMERELMHFTEYKRAEEETRRFRHDMINNLSCVEALLQEGKSEEAKRYVEELSGIVKALTPKVVTGDEMLDCIISSKWDTMKEAGIIFTVDGVLDRGLSWQPIDICTVFANALDNAMEACMYIEGTRRISMTCKHTKNFYFIELKNSMREDMDIDALEGDRFTTKKHKEWHGYGMDNMKRILKKYDSNMEIQKEAGMFVLKMVIPG